MERGEALTLVYAAKTCRLEIEVSQGGPQGKALTTTDMMMITTVALHRHAVRDMTAHEETVIDRNMVGGKTTMPVTKRM